MKLKLPGYNKLYVADANKVKRGLQAGLFAEKSLRVGEQIFIAKGDLVTMNINNSKQSQSYANALGIKRGVWINPTNKNPLRYLNHSCDPNAGIKGEVTIVARKPIRKDEHITIDYSITECDELWSLDKHCRCGAAKCRGKIGPIQSLPQTLFKKYLPFINQHMQREYYKAKQRV